MANTIARKYPLTALYPILPGGHAATLRSYLRALDAGDYGSPLARVGCIHMARFAIIDDIVYQGVPAKRDHLRSRYLLFVCDFDGATLDVLTRAFVGAVQTTVDEIWQHCVAYPSTARLDELTAYFERCEFKPSLYLADRDAEDVQSILSALAAKRRFADFVVETQVQGTSDLKERFYQMMKDLASAPPPPPGSL